MTTLTINSSDTYKPSVDLVRDGMCFNREDDIGPVKSQVILPYIEQVLQASHSDLKDIEEIRVHVGPGSFTGLRVGIAIATILGCLLNVPVRTQHGSDVIEPIYGGEPSFLERH